MIKNKKQIIEYFKSGIKKTKDFKIGIEHEKFLFNNINNKVIDSRIQDFKDFVESKLNESNTGHVTEQGDVETWHGKLNVERVDEYVKETVEYLESLKK